MRIRDIMTSALVTVSPQTRFADARAEMSRRHIRHLLVTEGDQLAGIITDRDIRLSLLSAAASLSAWEIWEIDHQLARLTVGEMMSGDVTTIDPNRSVHEAARIMIDRKIGALPVLSGRELVGIITDTDILQALGLQMVQNIPDPGQTVATGVVAG